jgi:hypothetical protein
MKAREWAEEALAGMNDKALFMDGHDEAIIGVTADQAGLPSPVVVYDECLIIEALVDEGMDREDAWDHYGFNIQGGYYGENQPLIIRRPSDEGDRRG